MDIKQAIEKAGPGGKICRKGMLGIVTIGEDALMENEREVTNFGINNLIATDWQVIPEERIEVGDTIKGPCDKENPELQCEVLKHGLILSRLGLIGGNAICCCNKYMTKDLTLIHKGPKVHRFEGIYFAKMECDRGYKVVPMASGGYRFQYGMGMDEGPAYNLAHNGKTYRMTLEPMP